MTQQAKRRHAARLRRKPKRRLRLYDPASVEVFVGGEKMEIEWSPLHRYGTERRKPATATWSISPLELTVTSSVQMIPAGGTWTPVNVPDDATATITVSQKHEHPGDYVYLERKL
jgi:hypothetical protein